MDGQRRTLSPGEYVVAVKPAARGVSEVAA